MPRSASITTRRTIQIELNQYWADYFRPPTMRELMELCDLSSTSVVKYHLDILAREGLIDLRKGSRGATPLWVVDAIFDAANNRSINR